MTLENQLKNEILSKYKSIRAFTNAFDIPYSTLDSAFKRGINNIGIGTALKIFGALNLDIESVKNGTLKYLEPERTSCDLTNEEMQHIEKYRSLDDHGKEAVTGILDIEFKRVQKQAEKAETENVVELNEISATPFAARNGGLQPSNPTRERHLRCLEKALAKEEGEND